MTAVPLKFREVDGDVEFPVLVSAGSARPGIRGLHGDAIKIAVASPPERGRANADLKSLVAEWLGVSTREISVVAGMASRRKRIRIAGLTGREMQQAVDKIAK